MQAGGEVDIFAWWLEIPVVTRTYLTAIFAVTALTALDVLTPFDLYFNAKKILDGQAWRLVTTFLYFGPLGLNFLLHMYFA